MVHTNIIVEIPKNCKIKTTSKKSKKKYMYLYLGSKREKGAKYPKPNLLHIGTYIIENKMHPNDNYYKHFGIDKPEI